MGDVIQLFRDGGAEETFDPTEVLTEQFQDELVDTTSDINALWHCTTRESFERQMAAIKERVAGWPDG